MADSGIYEINIANIRKHPWQLKIRSPFWDYITFYAGIIGIDMDYIEINYEILTVSWPFAFLLFLYLLYI